MPPHEAHRKHTRRSEREQEPQLAPSHLCSTHPKSEGPPHQVGPPHAYRVRTHPEKDESHAHSEEQTWDSSKSLTSRQNHQHPHHPSRYTSREQDRNKIRRDERLTNHDGRARRHQERTDPNQSTSPTRYLQQTDKDHPTRLHSHQTYSAPCPIRVTYSDPPSPDPRTPETKRRKHDISHQSARHINTSHESTSSKV